MDRLTKIANPLGALLKEKQQTVMIAESSSGGLMSAALLSVSGASAYFQGGGVIYTQEARRQLLGLPEDVVTMRASTEEYAMLVANAAREKMGTTWAMAETGASGPTGNRYGDAAGHCCLAVVGPVEKAITIETGLSDREENMWLFAEAGLELLKSVVE